MDRTIIYKLIILLTLKFNQNLGRFKPSMKLRFATILFVLFFVMANNCSNDKPTENLNFSLISAHKDSKNIFKIIIKWPGDDFASKQDLEIRDKIEKRLSENGLGKIVQSGTGMGWMDIIVDVKDKDSARSEIEGIIRKISPNSKFEIKY